MEFQSSRLGWFTALLANVFLTKLQSKIIPMVTNSLIPIGSDRAKLTFYNSPKLQQITAILNKKSQTPLTTLTMALIGSY